MYKFYIICVLALSTLSVQAAAVSWDGDAGDGLWSSPTNWSTDNLPGSADDVTISLGTTINLSALTTAIKSLNIGGNSTLTVSSTGNLTIDGAASKGIFSSAGTTINNNEVILVMNSGDNGLEIEGSFNNNMGPILTSMDNGDKGIFVRGAFKNTSTGVIMIDFSGTTTAVATDDGTIMLTAIIAE